MNNSEFEDLCGLAKGIVYKKYKGESNIDPEELVMEAYSDLHEKQNYPDFIVLMKRKIKHLVYFREHGRIQYVKENGETIKTAKCWRCHEQKSISQFYTHYQKFTKESNYPNSYCKLCFKEYISQYQKLPHYKEANKQRQRKYISQNRDKWNNYLKDRYKKEKEELSDSYIKRLLKGNKAIKEITPELINAKRTELKLKRL